MLNGSLIIDFGWFGVGLYRGLFPGICLGPVKVMWVRGTVEAKFRQWQSALTAAAESLGRSVEDLGWPP